MKAITLPVIAVSLAMVMPVFADNSHHPAQSDAMQGPTAQLDDKTMQQMQNNLATMQNQLARLGKAKTADERQKIMNDHMRTMQENMGVMHAMMGQGAQGGMGMMGHTMQGNPTKPVN